MKKDNTMKELDRLIKLAANKAKTLEREAAEERARKELAIHIVISTVMKFLGYCVMIIAAICVGAVAAVAGGEK